MKAESTLRRELRRCRELIDSKPTDDDAVALWAIQQTLMWALGQDAMRPVGVIENASAHYDADDVARTERLGL